MKYVLTIENEPKLLAQVAEAILLSDPKIIIRNFNTFDGFKNWMDLFEQNGPSALNQAGYTLDDALESSSLSHALADTRKKNETHSIKIVGKELNEHLVLMVVKLEMIQKDQLQQIATCLKKFEAANACTTESPTNLVFTAFESPTFKVREYMLPHIGNILFKPFDKPILNQQIFFALNGHQASKSEYVFQQKTTALIEMMKEGEIDGYSEVGLVTLNDKKIEPGALSKLYTKAIETEQLKSVFAVCVYSEAHPSQPELALCYFKYFAIKNEQLLALRKNLKESKSSKTREFKKAPIIDKMGRFLHVAIICADESSAQIEETLVRNFKLLKVAKYKEALDIMKLMKSEPIAIDAVIFVNSFFADNPEKQTASFREMMAQFNPLYTGERAHLFPVFVISQQVLSKETEKEFSKFVTNIFYQPIDRPYFLKQFYLELNFLLFKEMPIELSYVPSPSPLKIATSIETIDLSEAAIDFNYVKPLQLGGFRKFILTTESESNMMEILGKCHYVHEEKEKDSFLHQFVFFALNDSFLKAIRLWIRNTYIQSKEG